MENINQVLIYLALVSVAAERCTDIIKKVYLAKLSNVNGAVYQVVSGLFGAMLAYYSPPDIRLLNFNPYLMSLLVGLAVSGGSSVWHDLLETTKSFSKSFTK